MNETKLPGGWKWVPLEPTEEILVAGQRCGVNSAWSYDKCYRAMIAAAPAPATWSSATAPGPDGMQHCIAVPGMPSAARDAALEEAARLADDECKEYTFAGYHGPAGVADTLAVKIRALMSVPGPVAPPVPQSDDDTLFLAHWDSVSDQYRSGMWLETAFDAAYEAARAAWFAAHATPAPVQQAAPSTIQTWQERIADAWPHLELDDLACEPKAARMQAEIDDLREALAAPAQPVALSEQDRLRNKLVAALETAQKTLRAARIATKFHAPHADDAIDAAILAAKEAP